MKKSLTIAIIILTSMAANAQYVWSANTFYLIPPTNGCNGVWAIYNPYGCSTYTWTGCPVCFQPDHIHGDTLFVKLCCIPCTITGTTMNGDACMQATCGLATGIAEYNNIEKLDITWQDHYTFTMQNIQDAFDRVIIVSITGQIIKEWPKLNGNETITFNTNNLANGLYIINTFKNGAIVNMKKIIKD